MSNAVYVVRATKDSDNPYKLLLRATFDGSELNFEERGVLSYILMKPDDWRVQIKDIMREGKIGRDKTYSIINGLIAKGYAERVEIRDEKTKQFKGHVILVYERPLEGKEPLPEKPYTDEPLPEKPEAGKPDTEKPLPANTEHTNKGILLNSDPLLNNEESGATPQTDPPAAKKSSKKKGSASSRYSDHPLIKAYHDVFERYPADRHAKAIIEADPPVANWVRACRAWNLAPYNPLNFKGLLDWAENPSKINGSNGPTNIGNNKRTTKLTARATEVDNGDSNSDNQWDPEELERIKAEKRAREAAVKASVSPNSGSASSPPRNLRL